MSTPLPIFFDCAMPDEIEKLQGWLVPDTARTLAVDERWPAHWRVTHVASGRGVMPPDKAELTTRDQAIGFARRFYEAATELGVNLRSNDWESIRRRLYDEQGHQELVSFWQRVL